MITQHVVLVMRVVEKIGNLETVLKEENEKEIPAAF